MYKRENLDCHEGKKGPQEGTSEEDMTLGLGEGKCGKGFRVIRGRERHRKREAEGRDRRGRGGERQKNRQRQRQM